MKKICIFIHNNLLIKENFNLKNVRTKSSDFKFNIKKQFNPVSKCKPIAVEKTKITEILYSEEHSIEKSLFTGQNQIAKHVKRMDNNCHIPDFNFLDTKIV